MFSVAEKVGIVVGVIASSCSLLLFSWVCQKKIRQAYQRRKGKKELAAGMRAVGEADGEEPPDDHLEEVIRPPLRPCYRPPVGAPVMEGREGGGHYNLRSRPSTPSREKNVLGHSQERVVREVRAHPPVVRAPTVVIKATDLVKGKMGEMKGLLIMQESVRTKINCKLAVINEEVLIYLRISKKILIHNIIKIFMCTLFI